VSFFIVLKNIRVNVISLFTGDVILKYDGFKKSTITCTTISQDYKIIALGSNKEY